MEFDSPLQKIRRQWFWKARWYVFGCALLGALLTALPQGPLHRIAFDFTSVRAAAEPPIEVVIVEIDTATKKVLGQAPDRPLDRRLYAQAVRRLKAEGARVVVFDLLFDAPSDDANADADFGAALKEHGAVVLAVELVEGTEDTHQTLSVIKPIDALATNAAAWGSSAVALDVDQAVRQHMTNPPIAPGLGVQAARLLGRTGLIDFERNGVLPPRRFLRWYAPNAFRRIDFAALIQTNSTLSLRDTVVIVGAKPGPGLPGEKKDTFASPWWLLGERFVSGPTVHAVILANYAAGDWVREMPIWMRVALGAFWPAMATLVAWRFNVGRRVRLILVPILSIVLSAVVAVVLFRFGGVWWPWIPAGVLLPMAVAMWFGRKPSPPPLDVFISYRNLDGDTAARLFTELNRRKLVAFYAPETIAAGSFHEHLPSEVLRARCVVPLLSKGTFQSAPTNEASPEKKDWVRIEIQTARDAGIPLLPMVKDGFEFDPAHWPAELGPVEEWQQLTKVEFTTGGSIAAAAEKIEHHVRSLDRAGTGR
jgi:CHASE2 domain-containing sensor protein